MNATPGYGFREKLAAWQQAQQTMVDALISLHQDFGNTLALSQLDAALHLLPYLEKSAKDDPGYDASVAAAGVRIQAANIDPHVRQTLVEFRDYRTPAGYYLATQIDTLLGANQS